MEESAFTLYEEEFDRMTTFYNNIQNTVRTGVIEMERYGPHTTSATAYIGPLGWPRRKASTVLGEDDYEDITAFAAAVQDAGCQEATVTVDLRMEAAYEDANEPLVQWVTGVQAGSPGKKHIHLAVDGPYVVDAVWSDLPHTAVRVSEEEAVDSQRARHRADDWLAHLTNMVSNTSGRGQNANQAGYRSTCSLKNRSTAVTAISSSCSAR